MKLVVFFIICVIYLFLTIVHKDETKFKSVKKVRFDLDKNDVIIISNTIKTTFDKKRYGQDIIKAEKVVHTNEIPNIQKEYVKKLEEAKKSTDEFNNIFKDQKPYWDSLGIDLNRSYDNYQVNNFNNLRNDNIRGKEISDVYNDLTYSVGVSESNLMHYDSDVMSDVLY
jgi:hypothetical protein